MLNEHTTHKYCVVGEDRRWPAVERYGRIPQSLQRRTLNKQKNRSKDREYDETGRDEV